MCPIESMRMLSGLMSLREREGEIVLFWVRERCRVEERGEERRDEPMDESKLVDRLDGEDALSHVELGHVLRESIVLDQPGRAAQRSRSASTEEREMGSDVETHIVMRSPPGRNSINRYRKLGSWNE